MTNEEKAKLLILNMKRCIELMESPNFKIKRETWRDHSNSELKAKLHEVRRDSAGLEKLMYPRWDHIHK